MCLLKHHFQQNSLSHLSGCNVNVYTKRRQANPRSVTKCNSAIPWLTDGLFRGGRQIDQSVAFDVQGQK